MLVAINGGARDTMPFPHFHIFPNYPKVEDEVKSLLGLGHFQGPVCICICTRFECSHYTTT